MKKIKLFAALTAALFVVVASAFTPSKPPSLQIYGWQDGISSIVHDQKELVNGVLVDFTQYRDLVLLDQVTDESCDEDATSPRCQIQLSATEETNNVRFTNIGTYKRTVRVREPLITSSSYVVDPMDGDKLSFTAPQ